MRTDPRVEVVVVNRNGRPHLAKCLRSLRDQEYGRFGVVVVDNDSSDGSREEVARDFPEFRRIHLGRNRGFGAAVNAGFASVDADYYALLNSDAEAPRNWIRALVEEAAKRRGIGMVACDIVEGGAGGGRVSSGLTVSRDGFALLRWNDLEDAPLLGPSGAAALYAAPLIDGTGGFEENYFLYYEDADLAMRARLLGWECAHAASAPVRHVHSASAGKDRRGKRRLLHRNRLEFIARCWPRPLLLAHAHWIVLGEAGALAYSLLRARPVEFARNLADLAAVAIRLPALRRRAASIPVRAAPPRLWPRSGGISILRRRLPGRKP